MSELEEGCEAGQWRATASPAALERFHCMFAARQAGAFVCGQYSVQWSV